LRDGLRKLGYVEGQNINFEFRSADGKFDLLPKLGAELVALRVDVIVALYTPCALAAQQATREIPVVVVSGDPVGTGLVTSLNRPGGNITGVSLMAAELHGKCVELFRDMLPSVRRVAVLLNAEDPFWKQVQQQVQLAGRAARIEIAPSVKVRGPNEIDAAFAAMKKDEAGAVVVHGSLSTKNVAELALKHGVTISITRRLGILSTMRPNSSRLEGSVQCRSPPPTPPSSFPLRTAECRRCGRAPIGVRLPACAPPQPTDHERTRARWSLRSAPSSRAISEACKLAGTVRAEDGTAAAVCRASPSVANHVAFNGDVARDLSAQVLELAEKQRASFPRVLGQV
jgi:hypothetical protein